MTGYTVHTGSSDKFAAGWDQIFSSGKPKKDARPKKEKSAKAKAKSGKKKSGRKAKGGK